MTPFAIVDTLGWLTPAGIFVLSLLFLAVDEIGAEIEDPFGACTSVSASATGPVVECAYRACVSACLVARAISGSLRYLSCLRAFHPFREERPHCSG